jgi:zinc transporter, ZIP family
MNYTFAFLLTLFAGLSTGIGGILVFNKMALSKKFLAASLGFSAGVMIYVSFVEILAKSTESLIVSFGETWGVIYATLAFFVGVLIIAVIDRIVPVAENPHELIDEKDLKSKKNVAIRDKYLIRMGLFSAGAIALHNLPEGLATFIAAVEDPNIGISIAIAIAIHNIPEGVAIAIPIYYATKSRNKALLYSFLSGLSEPLGALLGMFILTYFVSDLWFGVIFGLVAGIMVYISLDELLPTAEKYGEHHLAIYGLISGMLVMAVSLIIV